MNSIAMTWRGTFIGLALFLAFDLFATDPLDNVNYILIEDHSHPEKSRLLIFNDSHSKISGNNSVRQSERDEIQAPLIMLQATSSRHKVRGLTLLAGFDDALILDAAMELLDDREVAVRKEAVSLAMNHPLADHDLIAAKGLADASERVRELAADLVEELRHD